MIMLAIEVAHWAWTNSPGWERAVSWTRTYPSHAYSAWPGPVSVVFSETPRSTF